MDKITLKSIEYFASHGYYDSEREKGNRFEVDIVAEGDFRKAANEEDLNDTFDYETAEKAASEIMNGTSEKLIETGTCIRLFDSFSIVMASSCVPVKND